MKDRWTAIALAFLLGGLGIHRFYLRQPILGIIHIIFCWTFIPALVSIIDAITWILQDENTFNAKYNGYVSKR